MTDNGYHSNQKQNAEHYKEAHVSMYSQSLGAPGPPYIGYSTPETGSNGPIAL